MVIFEQGACAAAEPTPYSISTSKARYPARLRRKMRYRKDGEGDGTEGRGGETDLGPVKNAGQGEGKEGLR